MRIAICDDEKILVDDLHEKIENIMREWSVNAKIYDFFEADDLLYDIEANGIFDIIFLDIKIGEVNGIDVASILNDKEYIFTLIFVSQYDIYYRAAFEVQPFWFLDKPVDREKLKISLSKAINNVKYTYETYEYFYNKELYRVMVDKIMYVHSSKRIVYIHCIGENVYKCYQKLKEVEESLEEKHRKFVKINRSVIVNPMYVRKWTYKDVFLVNEEILSIGITYRDKVKEQYLDEVIKRIKKYD